MIIPIWKLLPHHFGATLEAFIKEHNSLNIVETGAGISTYYMLSALEQLKDGSLISIDPQPALSPTFTYTDYQPKYKCVNKLARECLLEIYKETGPLDIFLHDGNHNCFAQTLDIWFGWGMIKRGGYLLCDDSGWGQHQSWHKFIENKKLPYLILTDSLLAMAQKNEDAVDESNAAAYFIECIERAELAEKIYFAAGGKDSKHGQR